MWKILSFFSYSIAILCLSSLIKHSDSVVEAVDATAYYSPAPRLNHATGLIGDKAYFFGGKFSQETYYNDLFYLDLSVNFNQSSPPFVDLKDIPDIPALQSSAYTLGVDNSTLYLFGGWEETSTITESKKVYVIDIKQANSTWTVYDNDTAAYKNDVWPSPRYSTSTKIDGNGLMYLWGGMFWSADGNPPNDTTMYIFNTNTKKWTISLPANAPLQRYDYATTLLSDGRIIYTGGELYGQNASAKMEEVLIYDTTKLQWSVKMTVSQTPGVPRSAHTAVLAQDGYNILIYGGSSDDIKFPLVMLNTNNFTWSYPTLIGNYGPKFLPRLHTATLYKNYMIIAFGQRNGNPSSEINILDISNLTTYNVATWVSSARLSSVDTNATTTNTTPTTDSPSPSPLTSNQSDSSNNQNVIIGGSIAGVVVVILIVGAAAFLFYQKRKKKSSIADDSQHEQLQHEQLHEVVLDTSNIDIESRHEHSSQVADIESRHEHSSQVVNI
ncbi:2238_t:CDS:2 [Ambispora leptoticha]|uniref:2238_t:CDS:1 n=1 Tax=Ambispora leptoticha TaxID=144679 RepID=A0A9N9FQW4_9GLOM|nr:2238_t:CDS:2 [Ambispora leptoticha]